LSVQFQKVSSISTYDCFPSEILSNSSSTALVNLYSIICGKYFSRKSVTIKAVSVGQRCLLVIFSIYPLLIIVSIVGAYVEGLPIPSHSIFLTREASVYLAGGLENN